MKIKISKARAASTKVSTFGYPQKIRVKFLGGLFFKDNRIIFYTRNTIMYFFDYKFRRTIIKNIVKGKKS